MSFATYRSHIYVYLWIAVVYRILYSCPKKTKQQLYIRRVVNYHALCQELIQLEYPSGCCVWGHSGEKDCTCQSLTVANGFGSPDWLRVLPTDVLCIVYKHTLFYVFNLPGHLLAVKQLHLLTFF